MPCSIFAGYCNQEITNFYEIVQGGFVAIISEEKNFNSDVWTCTNYIIYPLIFYIHLVIFL